MDKISNEVVLQKIKEGRTLLKIIKRLEIWIWYTLSRADTGNSFRRVEDKRGIETPGWYSVECYLKNSTLKSGIDVNGGGGGICDFLHDRIPYDVMITWIVW